MNESVALNQQNDRIYLGEIEKEVFGSLDDRRMAAEFAPGRLELHGVDQLAALIALVTSSIVIATQRTRPFHEAISQESLQKQ